MNQERNDPTEPSDPTAGDDALAGGDFTDELTEGEVEADSESGSTAGASSLEYEEQSPLQEE